MKTSNSAKRLQELMDRRGLKQVDVLRLCQPYCTMLGEKLNRSHLSQYVNGRVEPSQRKLTVLAKALNVSEAWLMGYDVNMDGSLRPLNDFGLSPLSPSKKVPRLGRIPCGEPAEMYQNIEAYDELPEGIVADYTLVCEGDSMINAKIEDGDIVYIRQQETVDNGEIAAVWYDGATTLKRFYQNGEAVTLMPENPRYAPIFIAGENLARLQILGKAVGFTRIFR